MDSKTKNELDILFQEYEEKIMEDVGPKVQGKYLGLLKEDLIHLFAMRFKDAVI